MVNMMQKTMLDGMRFYYKTAFWYADVVQDQLQKAWKMTLEQNGKMQVEVEGLMTSWMLNAKKGRDDLQLDMEKGFGAMEESLDDINVGSLPLSAMYTNWPEMQAEALRMWMGIWGLPGEESGGKGMQEKGDGPAAKSKRTLSRYQGNDQARVQRGQSRVLRDPAPKTFEEVDHGGRILESLLLPAGTRRCKRQAALRPRIDGAPGEYLPGQNGQDGIAPG